MKQIVLSIAIFCLGGISFWMLSNWLKNAPTEENTDPALEARLEAQRLADQARSPTNIPTITDEPSDSAVVIENNRPDDSGIFGGEMVIEGPFKINGTNGHQANGEVEIIRSPEETLIRYKNYQGSAGIGRYVYLAKDLTGKDHISLGESQGETGEFIYGAPLDVDFTIYPYILTWSVAEGEAFDYARVN